jgi:hypothetical protein
MKDREVLSQERSKERKMGTDCCDLNILLYLFLAMKIPQDRMLILATSQNKGMNYRQKLVYIAKKDCRGSSCGACGGLYLFRYSLGHNFEMLVAV